MTGPPIVNVILALGQYFRQFVVPVGLSPWYPPPEGVGFAHPRFVSALVTVLMVAVIAILCMRRTWVPFLALVWFMTAVGPTLPFFPARRALAADRYVYLPNVGLCWLVGIGIVWLIARWTKPPVTHRTAIVAGAMLAAGFTPGLWHALGFYKDNIASADRIAVCFPDEPGVYEASAWSRYREGLYEEAIGVAQREMEQHRETMAHKVLMVVGMSQYRLGRTEEAIHSLKDAVAHKPDYGKCYSRLAQVLAAAGQTNEAITNYERAAEIMPFYNPGLLPLAKLYRDVGRFADARRVYDDVLINNAYDVTAPPRHRRAGLGCGQQSEGRRPIGATAWLDAGNSVARTNLAVAFDRMGQTSLALRAYQQVIATDPGNMTAYVNLAGLYQRMGDTLASQRVYDDGLERFADNLDVSDSVP